MLNSDHFYLQRCVDLAQLATARTSPNPQVGAVLVHQGRIIGEGYHKISGQAHAEVNCVASVKEKDRSLIPEATLYVSLEPCCFHGRTPACTDLILRENIKEVVIGPLDQTAEVSGQGVEILRASGVNVRIINHYVPAERLAQPRQVYAAQKRPYILLKYAKSADDFLAPLNQNDYWITHPLSRRTVHYWRSRTSAILIGAGTLLQDDPQLDTRLYPGPSPRVVVVDPKGKINQQQFRIHQLKDRPQSILFQPKSNTKSADFERVFIPSYPKSPYANPMGLQSSDPHPAAASTFLAPILEHLHTLGHSHITVEGGRWLLQQCLSAGYWDEARVFTGTQTYFYEGLAAPVISGQPESEVTISKDRLQRWYRNEM
ncbi:MAG: bifunctional diaminohydroxyphosphoribosylaminopyrimidine deaminase/5-amino-6-(5-phosphoribosylamino)uracil reductase RibD [Bacteroidota bacterium]